LVSAGFPLIPLTFWMAGQEFWDSSPFSNLEHQAVNG
jgi:hypothetical protein